jgi:hypothetical protein
MKKLAKKVGLWKPESERTAKQRAVRDVVFWIVVVYAVVLTFFAADAEVRLAQAECNYATADVSASNVAIAQLSQL